MTAIVFDLDGTLIDSAPDIHAAVSLTLARNGHKELSLAEVTSFVGNGLPKLVERVMVRVGIDLDGHDAMTAEVLADYDSVNGKLTRVYPGVCAALEAFEQHGHAMAICTNKPEAPARAILKALDLDRAFRVVIGGDSLPVRKPDPEPLLATIARVDGSPETAVYVGDSEVDAETAQRAGVTFALYSGGYRKTPVSQIPHDFCFETFDELISYIADGAPAPTG